MKPRAAAAALGKRLASPTTVIMAGWGSITAGTCLKSLWVGLIVAGALAVLGGLAYAKAAA